MQKFKQIVSEKALEAVKSVFPDALISSDDLASMLEYPPDTTMGDLALPCFKLSKTLRRSPVQIAQIIAEKLVDPSIKKAEAVNGYLNISISDEYLCSVLCGEVLANGDKYGSADFGKGKTVVLDYSSPNVAKPFHIGHLGTTVIGHSLKKLHEFVGYDCVGINYLGDWGTQFGK
ncbi:MAG: arginine--tRNA ligase, partial [Clostridia bacterium]|nr:arginine--tRNA ligase [Clostridia bacterium]